MRKALIAVLATVAMTGCASTGSSPAMTSNSGVLPPVDDRTTIEVSNFNWSDMVVYAVHYNNRYRLGMVTSMNSRRFTLPRSVQASSADLRLMANPIGGHEEFVTQAIHVQPGQRVELRIENQLAISNWSVW